MISDGSYAAAFQRIPYEGKAYAILRVLQIAGGHFGPSDRIHGDAGHGR